MINILWRSVTQSDGPGGGWPTPNQPSHFVLNCATKFQSLSRTPEHIVMEYKPQCESCAIHEVPFIDLSTIGLAFTMTHPFPPEADSLPLYAEDDGFYSVNGPAFYGNPSGHPTSNLLDNQISDPTSQSPFISPHLHQHPIMTMDELVILLYASESPLPTPIPPPSFYSQQSPQTSSQKNYVCNESGCTWRPPFKTKQGLRRHREAVHLQKRYDCWFPGCERVGKKGIKRKDNLRTHLRDQHGVQLPLESRLK